jgi:PAS domain-containing protein
MYEATIVLGPDGEYENANEAALALLGLSLEELRSLAAGALSTLDPSESADLRERWQQANPDAAIGRSTVRRADGSQLAVRFVLRRVPGGRWEANLRPLDRPLTRPALFLSVGDVLAAWRAAERRLDVLDPDSAESVQIKEEIEALRDEYRVLFDAGRKKP